MKSYYIRNAWFALFLFIVLSFAGCASIPKDQKHQSAGDTLFGQGKYEEAITEFTASLNEKPSNAQSRLGRAVAYAKTGRFADSIDDLTYLINNKWAEHPGGSLFGLGPNLYYSRGSVYWEKGEIDNCLADYESSINTSLRLVESWKSARTKPSSGQLTLIVDYSSPIMQNLISTYRARAALYEKTGRNDEAQKDMEQYIKYKQEYDARKR
jgi:tetratricopeptide (TPR) repeat protein